MESLAAGKTADKFRRSTARYAVLLLDPFREHPPVIIHESNTRREAFASAKEWDKRPNGRVAVAWPYWAPMPEGAVNLDDLVEDSEGAA